MRILSWIEHLAPRIEWCLYFEDIVQPRCNKCPFGVRFSAEALPKSYLSIIGVWLRRVTIRSTYLYVSRWNQRWKCGWSRASRDKGGRTKDKSGCPYYDCKNEVVALMDEESLKLHIFCKHFFVIIGLNAWIISRVGVEWSVRTSERSEWK